MKLSVISITGLVVALCAFAVSAQQTQPRTLNGGVLNGKAVSLPKPEYPADARNAGVEGAVKVKVIIDENGNIEAAAAVKDEDAEKDMPQVTVDAWAALRDSAEKAALAAKFSPTLLSGQPVKVAGMIVYNFALGAPTEEETRPISGGTLNGKAISLPKPDYPADARAAGIGGVVKVQITIDESGDVVSAKAISGDESLQLPAETAARAAKFSPTLLNGQPVHVVGILTYNFVPSTTAKKPQ